MYLFTLEIAPLEVGKTYVELPSHLTLMSRFWSKLAPEELANAVQPLFAQTDELELVFGNTVELGPKKLTVHLVEHSDELKNLHNNLLAQFDSIHAEYEYPQYIGDNHKPHVTQRDGVQFAKGDTRISQAAYLIEIIDKKRVVRSKFNLGE